MKFKGKIQVEEDGSEDPAGAFLLAVAMLSKAAADLHEWSVDYLLSLNPDKVDWGDVGDVNAVLESVQQVVDELPERKTARGESEDE